MTKGAGPFTITVVPVRPTSVASIPDSVPQNGSANDLSLSIDGGYFGSGGLLAKPFFNGNESSSRCHFVYAATESQSAIQRRQFGIARSIPAFCRAHYSSAACAQQSVRNEPGRISRLLHHRAVSGRVRGNAGANPGAVDFDTRLGILAVAEPGSNQVEFFSVGAATLTSIGTQKVNTATGVLGVPSGLSINQNNHTVAVVDFQNQGVIVFPLPGQTGDPNITYPLRISLSGLIPSTFTPAPLAYSIGVDSDTNNAVVAYSSTANPTTAKIGFLLDLNKDTQACLPSLTSATPPCIHAQVTLNTGQFPQIAMIPHSHQALVTPGGAGIIQGVDVTQASASFTIGNVTVSSGLATVTLNIPSGQTLSLNPGNPGSVLIQNVPLGTAHGTDFNGVFTIQNVLNNNSFTYALAAPQNDSAIPNQSPDTSFAFFGSPNISISLARPRKVSPSIPSLAPRRSLMPTPPETTARRLTCSIRSINPFRRSLSMRAAPPTPPHAPERPNFWVHRRLLSSLTRICWCPTIRSKTRSQFRIQSHRAVMRLVCKSAAACQTNPVITSQVTLHRKRRRLRYDSLGRYLQSRRSAAERTQPFWRSRG